MLSPDSSNDSEKRGGYVSSVLFPNEIKAKKKAGVEVEYEGEECVHVLPILLCERDQP